MCIFGNNFTCICEQFLHLLRILPNVDNFLANISCKISPLMVFLTNNRVQNFPQNYQRAAIFRLYQTVLRGASFGNFGEEKYKTFPRSKRTNTCIFVRKCEMRFTSSVLLLIFDYFHIK